MIIILKGLIKVEIKISQILNGHTHHVFKSLLKEKLIKSLRKLRMYHIEYLIKHLKSQNVIEKEIVMKICFET